MIVTIRYFASLREAVGLGQENVTLPDGATMQTLLEALTNRHPGLTAHLGARSIRFAINRCYVLPDAGLKEGDEVALVPPVGGG